jgi:hypothetical protein
MYKQATMQAFLILFAVLATVATSTTYHPFVESGFDFVGNDIANAQGSAVDKCTALCEANPLCKAYSWSGYNNGTCWLKSARNEIVAKYGVISSYMWQQPVQICQLLNNTDFIGNDVASAPSPDISQCCYICSKTFNCRAYSWSNYNSGTCWLKSTRGVAVVKQGVSSADAYPNDAPLLLLHNDVDYVDHDIANQPSSKPEGCFSICKNVKGCGAFSWSNYNGGTCWLKSGKDKEINKSGVVSAVMP